MVKVVFHTASGKTHSVDAVEGLPLMRAAFDNRVPGIEAACGGSLACGTCHAYIDGSWLALLPPQSDMEKEMLDCGIHVQPNSRLTCQIPVTAEMEGIVVTIPSSQR